MSLTEELQRPGHATPSRASALNRPFRKTLGDAETRASQDMPLDPPTFTRGQDSRGQEASNETSLDLLDRASKGMAFIINRYKHLEEHIKQLDAWSTAQIQAAEASAHRWKEAAAASEKKLEEVQRNLEVMSRRADAAEQAMQRDREALLTLQDRIVAAFGLGSDAHDAIAATMENQ